MRILWVDDDKQPWTDEAGWKVMEDFGVAAQHIFSIDQARQIIPLRSYDVLFIRREMSGAEELLAGAKEILAGDPRKIVYGSSEWSRADFKAHAKTKNVADRYARIPMPVEGFLGTLADLFSLSVDDLREFKIDDESFSSSEVKLPEPVLESGETPDESGAFSISDSIEMPSNFHLTSPNLSIHPDSKINIGEGQTVPRESSSISDQTAEKFFQKNKIASLGGGSPDVDLLHKYLKLKEEQLSISESEKRELVNENERLQREAQGLQVKLREMSHLMDETSKKIRLMESEKDRIEKEKDKAQREHSSYERVHAERMKTVEAQLTDANEKYESLRVRVRKDIRKIRSNEKDLEAKYELLRKDSETLMHARDLKVLELQRKIDALEYDLDQVQDSRVQAQMESERYISKLTRVARALNIASAIIVDDQGHDSELDELEPELGGAGLANDEDGAHKSGNDAGKVPAQGAGAPPGDGDDEKIDVSELSPDMMALANDGDPTRIVTLKDAEAMEGEPESSSG